MTNKTIIGVPRWVLEVLADPHSPYDQLMPAKEHARALLAAPDPAKCQNCGLRTAEQCDDIGCGFLSAGNGAPDPIVEADGIGEPVAVVDSVVSRKENRFGIEILDNQKLHHGTKLYSADQLAALQSTIAQLKAENERLRGGLKFPDHKPEPTTAEVVDPDCNHSTGYADGWNDSLDEVRRMNYSLKSSK